MKLFQRLLVAPAAIGLLAPLAANASEVKIDNVVDYVNPAAEEVATTSAQFSDVVPGDWAYTSLQNLSESYGCVDHAYTQSLKNGQSITRYEAAALINACIDGGLSAEAITPDASRLTNEFGSEMAILKGRVNGLESRVNSFEAGQFSSTTSLSGSAHMVFGSAIDDDQSKVGNNDKLNAHYNYKLDLNTSFTGEDNLYVGIETGNIGGSSHLITDSTVVPTNSNALEITSLYYSFPVGDMTVAIGPLLDQDDLVPSTLSTYSNSFMLGGWNVGPNALSLMGFTGAGAGVAYTSDSGFNAGVSVIASDGADASKGIGSEEGSDTVTVMAGYDGDTFGGGISYAVMDNPSAAVSTAGYTVSTSVFNDDPNVIGVGAYWQISEGVDLSVGFDIFDLGVTGYEEVTTYAVGVDAAFGAGTLSAGLGAVPTWDANGNSDIAGHMFEVYYDYPVADGITIKPGIMWTSYDDAYETSEFGTVAVEATFNF